MLLEGTNAQRWVDLTFGLTEGWWRFTDRDLRTSHPLLSRQAWTRILQESGFNEITMLPGPGAADLPGQQSIIVCSVSGTADGASCCSSPATRRQLHRGAVRSPRAATGYRLRRQWTHRRASSRRRRRIAKCCAAIAGGTPLRGIVHVVAEPAPPRGDAADLSTLEASTRRSCSSVLALVQAMAGEQATEFGRLWLVTRGALPTASAAAALDQSPFGGSGAPSHRASRAVGRV